MDSGMDRRGFLRRSAAVAGAAVAARAAATLAAPEKPKIVVARGGGAVDSNEGAYNRMKAALDKFGGFPELVKGKRVLIKINATDGGYRDANTSSQAMEALLKICKDCAAKSVTLIGQEWNGWRAKRKGLPTLGQAAKTAGVPIKNLGRYWVKGTEADYKLIQPQPPGWKKLMVAKDIFDDDTVLLNLPRLKTHPHCAFTCCIKNTNGLTRAMFGYHMVDDTQWPKSHGDPANSDGWHVFPAKLAQAWKLAIGPRVALNIVDANQPNYGWRSPGVRINTFDEGAVLVGKDALALDVYCCGILSKGLNKIKPGFYPEPLGDWAKGDNPFVKFNRTKTNYLKTCADVGVGEADLGKVDVQEIKL